MRVLLADDHELVRAGLRALIETMPNVIVIGEAADGAEALSLAKQLQPDVVLMDIAMKNMNGLEATATLKQELPECKIIVLSMHASSDYLQQALSAGASGYILKGSRTQELKLALEAVSYGAVYLSPNISSHLFEVHDSVPCEAVDKQQLTDRQIQLLKLIAQGESTKEIAYQLNLSAKTVEAHRAQIMKKLGIFDVAGLVRYAIRTGYIDA